MRVCVLSLFLLTAVLFPRVGSAQVGQFRTHPPQVSAAAAEWQINSEPMPFAGLVYYPTREIRQFDGQVMAQMGVYQGVPIYADLTLEPYSLVYVPLGPDRVRMYERKRDHELAGTTGSRAPSFPVESPSVVPETLVTGPSDERQAAPARVVSTVGSVAPTPAPVETAAAPVRPRHTRIGSIPAPHAPNGIWLQFDGKRWYSAGVATSFSPDRFTPVGEYRGVPVYRDRNSAKDEIWVPMVKGGPLAPYTLR
jgi:hypothetical protein